MKTTNRIIAGALAIGLACGILAAQEAQQPAATSSEPGMALLLEVRGAIGPATSEYIAKGLQQAADTGARLVILEMDTPGGLDSAMRDIIKAIIASPVPVVTYVSPSGSRAASAGTYILYASHVAAMAPATNLGAATPVQIGGGAPRPPGTPEPAPEADQDEQQPSAPDGDGKQPAPGGTAMERKAVNDAVAYIRGLAELRGRNAEWAELAVLEAASLAADQALEQNVIDIVAASIPELLAAIDGRRVKVQDREVELAVADLSIERFEPDWRIKLLATITDPNVAYLLMLVGIYGLVFEGYNPGAIVPGVVGAICLLLALFAFQVLPVNYAGLALIGLGVALMVAEAFVPSFGALGLGGIAAFVFGSIILLDPDVPGMQISQSLIFAVALTGGLLLLGLMTMLVRIRRRPVVSGLEEMLGAEGHALTDFREGAGMIFVHGERWRARSSAPLRGGEAVRVSAVRGLTLEVEPLRRPSGQPLSPAT